MKFWSLQLNKNVIEKVQRREAKMIMVIEQLLYEKTLKRPFNSANKRMLEGEIKTYKITKAVDKVNEELL